MNLKKDTKILSSITILMCIILISFILIGYWHVQQDDSYIFYSYAKNLTNGNGYVFNPGEKICATTSPLYTILLFLIYSLVKSFPFISLPLVGHLIGIICLFLTSIFSIIILKKEKFEAVPFLFPVFFLANPLIKNAVGMETFLTVMLIFLSFYFYANNKFVATSLVCSFAVFSRPDSILIFIIFIMDYIRQKKRPPSLKFFSVFIFVLLPWFLFSKLYFGKILPSSLGVKLGQTKSGRWGSGFLFLKGLWSSSTWNGDIIKYIFLILLIICIFILAKYYRYISSKKKRIILLLLIYNFIYLMAYGLILNPPAYPWYYTPFAVGISLIFALSLESFITYYSQSKRTGTLKYIIYTLITVFIIGLLLPLKTKFDPVTAKHECYKLTAIWLNENAHNGASVGANEIGVLRYYYKKGAVIDGLGLVTPGVADHVRKKDYNWYVHEYEPDYLMFNYPHRHILEAMVEENWFQNEYQLSSVIKTNRKSIAIYKRQLTSRSYGASAPSGDLH